MTFIYNILMIIFATLGFPLLALVIMVSEKRRQTAFQRLGLVTLPRGVRKGTALKPHHKPIWVHALSVGEVVSAVSLVKGLRSRFKHKNLVFSVSTKTGFEVADKLLKSDTDAIFFFPYDFVFSVKRIVSAVDPAVVVLVESDIWPNFLTEMKRRIVPTVLVNGRLSKRSFEGYRRLSFFMRPLWLTFSKVCTQTLDDAKRFKELGVPSAKITRTGNLKFDQEYKPMAKTDLEELRQLVHMEPEQKILLAGSTHKGEEEIIVDAFSRIKRELSDLSLIIAPRHPGRAGSVCRLCRDAGFAAYPLTELDRLPSDSKLDVVVVDTIGLLRKLYALADIALVGGSLVRSGGQNPLEPAAFAKPILFGPDMRDFEEISQMLLQAGAALRVHDAEDVYSAAVMLLKDSNRSKDMGENALDVFGENRGAVEKTLEEINRILSF